AWAAGLALVLLGEATPAAAQPPAPDPVEQLHEALQTAPREPAARERALRLHSAAVRTLADLCRAVALPKWRDADPDAKIASIDAAARTALVKQFQDQVRDLLRTGDADTRRAVVVMLGDMGPAA